MDKLVDKVKQIYDTYADENTYFERIALVGCDTDGVGKTLTKDFAHAALNRLSFLGDFSFTIIPTINHFGAICCHGLGAIVIYLHFSYSARNFCIS
jgi:hypothetical protein